MIRSSERIHEPLPMEQRFRRWEREVAALGRDVSEWRRSIGQTQPDARSVRNFRRRHRRLEHRGYVLECEVWDSHWYDGLGFCDRASDGRSELCDYAWDIQWAVCGASPP